MTGNKTILLGMGKPTGPVPVHFLALANELENRGYSVRILMHCREPMEEIPEGPPVSFWKWRPTNKLARIFDFFYSARMIAKYKPVCVISGHRDTGSLIFSGFLYGTPVRIIWHHILTSQTDIDDKAIKLKLKLGRLLKIPFFAGMCTYVIGVSRSAIDDMRNIYKVPQEKLHLLYNSLPDPIRQETDPINMACGSVEERLVCLGRLSKSKGQDVLIRAIGFLTKQFPRIKLYIIGGGGCEENLKSLVCELGLADHVIFKGTVNHEEAMQLLSSASLSIVPSRMDNLPTTAIESLSFGVPIIGTLAGGIPEIITDDYNGILIPTDDAIALAESIKMLLENDELREKLRIHARKSFVEKFEQKLGVRIQADWIDGILSKTNL